LNNLKVKIIVPDFIIKKYRSSKDTVILSLFTVALILFAGCSPAARFTSNPRSSTATTYKTTKHTSIAKSETITGKKAIVGMASYYGDEFNGRKTASGDVYDKYQLTAAHKSLPFGSRLLVRNTQNGAEVEVIINDRGPYVDNRILDLSYAAAEAIGMVESGVVEVEIYVLN
jgi:rare lipoprotein A